MDRDTPLRLRLRVTLKLMGLFALVFFVGLLISGLFSRPGGDIQLPLEVDLRSIDAGEAQRLSWNGRRVLVLHRDRAMFEALAQDEALYDPASRFDRRPRSISASHRGWVPEWLVVYAESTDLGCDLEIVLPGAEGDWEGGFRDRCRQGRYDFAGRVYKGQPAMRNLEIPPHRIDGMRLILGAAHKGR
ncbi:ubiquinol-cytochrome C reductase, iron-sulfur subunit [Thioalkalivibrio sp.]|uniref:ubiquinol-cytochrome C reductase, iron-sulfur subunit n=1 Tax=Thioalkalivibrio sp. TaxID=2093813 RepID=UPI0012D59365|nr:ubiquinol-cytochrome C reductase, iron-sulfur subunit [Thioalkalivibrio sp.]TVP81879.1 MAG: ubiquinol-cytochrome C reductase, iron-sulfur subunit [Thioalkalivibrio sp.]